MPKHHAIMLAGLARLLTLCLLTLQLSACQTPIRLMPTPVSFKTGAVDPFAQAGAKLLGTEVPVFYATNRGAVIETPEPIHTVLPSERLRMGVAHVRIGDESLDWETLHRLSTSADADERPLVQLEWLEQMASLGPQQALADSSGARDFIDLLNKALAASESQELVIYVHGSNNTLPRGSAQAAQLRHFTGRRMVVLSFLWPSAGSLLKYFTDVGNAKASVEPFVRLLELLAEHSKASGINVLAYSAGAQIVSPALAHLGQSARPGETREQMRQRLRLNHVYFAAADIDTRRFVGDLKHYVDLADRISNAGNLNDSALRLAALVHRASRIGRLDRAELDAEQTGFLTEASQQYGFDLIKVDPGAIPTLARTSHAFWYEDPWVSSDLLGLLLLNAPPQQRGLESQSTAQGARYWTFPPDFDVRVKRLFTPAQ